MSGKNLKTLILTHFMSALRDFTADKEIPITGALTRFPLLDKLRIKLTAPTNPANIVVVATTGKRMDMPHREGPWEPIVQFGEYIYYNYSRTEIDIEINTFTVDENKSEHILDEITHFFSANVRIGMQGEALVTEPDYDEETLTYLYYDPTKWTGYRIKDLEFDSYQHEGDLYENMFSFTVEVTRMLAVRYAPIEQIEISSQSGSSYIWPAFLYSGSNGLISGTNLGSDALDIVFHIDESLYT